MLEGVSAVGSRMLGGRFQLVRRLGAGAFGTVYEAEDIDYKQRIAVKQLNVLAALKTSSIPTSSR